MKRLLLCLLVVSGMCVVDTPADAMPGYSWFNFVKRYNIDSTLHWKVGDGVNPPSIVRSWRTGSGTTTNTCETGKGWLPNGWYTSPFSSDTYSGSAIYGYVWRLQDKQCAGGTTIRTALFIHSEMTSSGGQAGCSSTADSGQCWERAADYYSNGCVKLSYPNYGFPDDVLNAHHYWHTQGTSTHSFSYDYALYVQ